MAVIPEEAVKCGCGSAHPPCVRSKPLYCVTCSENVTVAVMAVIDDPHTYFARASRVVSLVCLVCCVACYAIGYCRPSPATLLLGLLTAAILLEVVRQRLGPGQPNLFTTLTGLAGIRRLFYELLRSVHVRQASTSLYDGLDSQPAR